MKCTVNFVVNLPLTIQIRLEDIFQFDYYSSIQLQNHQQYLMLIPQFKITQDDDYVIVSIRLPYVKVTACEFYIDEKIFKFYLKPYLLSLSFEQPLKPAEQPSKAVYNHDKHILTVYLNKLNPKEYFENLNLLSNILQNKKTEKQIKQKPKTTLIEVLDQKGQKVIETEQNQLTQNQYAYGFGANYQNVFKNLQQEALELFLFNPKDVSITERYQLSRKIAYEQFDQDGYMFDKMSNFEEIDRIIESSEARDALIKLVKEYHGVNDNIDYEKFKSQMKIPNKEVMIAKGDHQNVWKQIISIVFSYLYELICMEGEFGVESSKTINKTNAVLSANVLYREQTLREVIYDCCRHCITYSLYKHIDICQKVIELMVKQLSLNLVTSILSDLRFMFEKSEPRYLLNTIYMNDFCIYVMSGPAEDKEKKIKEIVDEIGKIKIEQAGLELDIEGEQGQECGDSVLKNENQGAEGENQQLEMLLDLD